MSHISVAYR